MYKFTALFCFAINQISDNLLMNRLLWIQITPTNQHRGIVELYKPPFHLFDKKRMWSRKTEKASEMQQPSCKSKSFGQTGFLFSRFINVMCQVSIFWHCWFTRRRFLNIKIINHFRPPLGPFFGPQTYRT